MKSPKKSGRAGAKKATVKKAGGKTGRGPDPIAAMFDSLDDEMLEMMRRALEGEVGFDLNDDEVGDKASFILNAYIAHREAGDAPPEERNARLARLVDMLDDLRVDANGGDRAAREELQEVFAVLDDAIERGGLHPVDLMTLAKVLADAGLTVPETLKSAVESGMEADRSPFESLDTLKTDLASSLLQMVEIVDDDPFALHEQLKSVFVSLPTDAVTELLGDNFIGRSPIVDQAIAGFALHADAQIAGGAMRALAAQAARAPTPSLMIERLVRMRPWTPPERHGEIDAAVRAMRQNALPPVKGEQIKLLKCFTSIRDGSGGATVFTTLRGGGANLIATVMTKAFGVAETLVLRELPKSELDRISRGLKSSMPTGTTDLDGVAALLKLALADNLGSGVLPPFSLVEIAETLSLGPLHPNMATTAEIIERVLGAERAPTPPSLERDTAQQSDLVEGSWFEAGETVEDLLYPIKGHGRRVARLLNDYLPGRRDFWARQCAISALALRGVGEEPSRDAVRFALTGRALASGLPYAAIPLMRRIAESTVLAFQGRG
jgi:hypothetical protein